jgi:glutamate carboxypeptidase
MLAAAPATYVERLRRLCAIDSPTGHLAGLDACATVIAEWAAESGCAVDLLPSPVGLHVVARTRATGGPRILLLGHHDTVFPTGTAAVRSVRVEGDRALGPGVADMKGGVLVGLAALERLADSGIAVELHSVPDEESRNVAPFTLTTMHGADAS